MTLVTPARRPEDRFAPQPSSGDIAFLCDLCVLCGESLFHVLTTTSAVEPDYEGVILNSMKAHVWVMPKRTVLDPQGQTIQHALSGLGYAQVKDVRQGKFFVLNLDGWNREEAQRELERISKEVLTNPVIEEYRFEIVE